MFMRYDKNGNVIRNRVVLDCSDDEVIVEQSHKDDVNINNIVRKHGMDLIAKTAALQQFVFDDIPNNDFQEAMFIVAQAQETFDKLPSDLRKRFDNDPAKFMDFVHNPDNSDELVTMGLAIAPDPDPVPVQVEVVSSSSSPSEDLSNTETPPPPGAV